MTHEVEIKVLISLEDFFNSEEDKATTFRNAMQAAILQKLGESEFVQKNIAYYMFNKFKDEVFAEDFEKIKSAVKEKIEEFKEPDEWTIRSHDRYRNAMNEVFDDLQDTIKEATRKKALEFTEDDGRDYNSFYGKVADAMVDKVFENFVSAMVDKHNRT